MNPRTAIAGAVVVIVAAVLLIVLSSSGSDDSGKSDAGQFPTIRVDKQGHPVGGIADLTYHEGDQIHFRVKVPFAEEVHLHGYDVMKDVPAGGGAVTYDLPATIEGVFEAELEGRKEQIVQLTVEP